ncbi:hypothetical protein [Stigmatella aurantiaca]|uniref:Conserved uncharacterized protein n=1 Tax=Stigmatella aurantiaca (strain DW4/3-1) TaxID=378806 RepID=Q08V02_STIAD|nr:hypothetical protein [Stigmatella aurantiaca]ADO71203.1 conserved uncharacterized protein [Stigmatella aurantiaca DW4/3-1]EAU64309.1 hypothetical protein STIAU_4786 [Stigmatella aurantiaca DW4/3-1]
MKMPFALRALLTAAWLFGVPASASTMLKLDLTALSHTSDAVVHGTVRRVESRWSRDHRRILTDVEIEVSESLKGQPGSTVLLIQPGGRVGDIGQVVSGMASFTQGEEVVVFLERRGARAFGLVGMSQGKYEVRRAQDTHSVLAVPAVKDVHLLDPETRQPTALEPRTTTLDELKAAIRAALQQPKPTGAAQESRP